MKKWMDEIEKILTRMDGVKNEDDKKKKLTAEQETFAHE